MAACGGIAATLVYMGGGIVLGYLYGKQPLITSIESALTALGFSGLIFIGAFIMGLPIGAPFLWLIDRFFYSYRFRYSVGGALTGAAIYLLIMMKNNVDELALMEVSFIGFVAGCLMTFVMNWLDRRDLRRVAKIEKP